MPFLYQQGMRSLEDPDPEANFDVDKQIETAIENARKANKKKFNIRLDCTRFMYLPTEDIELWKKMIEEKRILDPTKL